MHKIVVTFLTVMVSSIIASGQTEKYYEVVTEKLRVLGGFDINDYGVYTGFRYYSKDTGYRPSLLVDMEGGEWLQTRFSGLPEESASKVNDVLALSNGKVAICGKHFLVVCDENTDRERTWISDDHSSINCYKMAESLDGKYLICLADVNYGDGSSGVMNTFIIDLETYATKIYKLNLDVMGRYFTAKNLTFNFMNNGLGLITYELEDKDKFRYFENDYQWSDGDVENHFVATFQFNGFENPVSHVKVFRNMTTKYVGSDMQFTVDLKMKDVQVDHETGDIYVLTCSSNKYMYLSKVKNDYDKFEVVDYYEARNESVVVYDEEKKQDVKYEMDDANGFAIVEYDGRRYFVIYSDCKVLRITAVPEEGKKFEDYKDFVYIVNKEEIGGIDIVGYGRSKNQDYIISKFRKKEDGDEWQTLYELGKINLFEYAFK